MENRFFIELQYDGKNYHGWQIQPNATTVQEILTTQLSLLTKEQIQTTGCGRTDAGVHANYFVAHFNSNHSIEFYNTPFIKKLNQILPSDIVVFRIVLVSPNAHARFDALSRTYKYYITQTKNPFNLNYNWLVHYNIDIEIMNVGATELLKFNDFTSFSKLHTDVKTNLCQIISAEWKADSEQFVFNITADRFLRNMVRAIVGTMVDLGRGKITLAQFQKIIQLKDRSLAGMSAPSKGLFLTNIKYPYDF